MEKPYKYSIYNKATKTWEDTNNLSAYYLNNPLFSVWEDARYPARTRLYKYWQKLNGITEPKYKPYKGTEIGKSEAILNF